MVERICFSIYRVRIHISVREDQVAKLRSAHSKESKMAEDKGVNGVANLGVDGQTEDFYDPDQGESHVDALELMRKIEALECEKDKLVNENAEKREEIKKLKLEIDGLRRDEAETKEKLIEMEGEVERSQEHIKAAEAIAARAAELETEVARLQHDSLTEMSASEEARTEVAELRRDLGDKEVKVETLERELDGLRKAKTESEIRVRDLERKLGILEVKEIEERSKKIRVEEDMREKIDEKEKEIRGFRQKIEDLEMIIKSKESQWEKQVKEKTNLEEELKESQHKARTMESNILQLQEEALEAEKFMKSLKDKALDAANVTVNGLDGEAKGLKELKLQWPVVAGSAGAVAAAAGVIYVCYGRRS
ncbi:hypothetical protein L6164_029338 [Bauhinia variegata]|uniref:Uncharacterized protein n=1 Tax=Bauhinia variegata TaxID=167791 RepID=A0ACB9L9A8_BAUVA|nr:hypothetical protein L6164_029338 [Bauhinia variegata]